MNIQSGLFPGQILQRDARQMARTRIAGRCETTRLATIEVYVTRDGIVLPGVSGSGEAKDGFWQASVDNLPVGGPYEIRFHLLDEPDLHVADVRVGDVWFLGGQIGRAHV